MAAIRLMKRREGRRVSTPRRPSPAELPARGRSPEVLRKLSCSVNDPPHKSNHFIDGYEPRSQSGSASL